MKRLLIPAAAAAVAVVVTLIGAESASASEASRFLLNSRF